MGTPQPGETAPITLPPESATTEAVTTQHLANIVFLSYRYSQGGIGTQNRLLSYMEDRYHGDFMTDERAAEVHELAKTMIGPYFLNQALHPAIAIPWDDDSPEAAKKTDTTVSNELIGLFERFNDENYMSHFSHDPASIAASIIIMDADYLQRPGGRAGDSIPLKIVVDPYKRDPYDSLFIKYGVLGKDSNSLEFNALFAVVSLESTIQQLDAYTVATLLKVINHYVDRHPDSAHDPRITDIRVLCERLQNGR
jgi:hypothetical protein